MPAQVDRPASITEGGWDPALSRPAIWGKGITPAKLHTGTGVPAKDGSRLLMPHGGLLFFLTYCKLSSLDCLFLVGWGFLAD